MAEKLLNLAYMICTTPRTGSTALLHALTSSGVAGLPGEYPDAVAHNGVYGVLVHSSRIPEDFELPPAKRHRYIHVYRNDLVLQAVSWVMAAQTGQWRSDQELVNAPVYDSDSISKGIKQLLLDNYQWHVWLDDKSPVLRISYETLSLDYAVETQKILKFLGLPKRTITPRLLKIGTDKNIEWAEKWKEGK